VSIFERESLLVGFTTTNFTRAWEPTLSWNQLRSKPPSQGEQTEQTCAKAYSQALLSR
jgi:hypothetical protein